MIDLDNVELEKLLLILLEGLKARRGAESLLNRIAELEEENKTLRKRIDNMQADFELKVKYMNAEFADEMAIYAQAYESDAEQTYRAEIIELQRQVRDLKKLAGLREDD